LSRLKKTRTDTAEIKTHDINKYDLATDIAQTSRQVRLLGWALDKALKQDASTFEWLDN